MKAQSSLFIFVLVSLFSTSVIAKNDSQWAFTQVNFTVSKPQSGDLVIGVFDNQVEKAASLFVGQESQEAILHAADLADFSGKKKTSALVYAPKSSGFGRLLLIGLGSKDNDELTWQQIGGYTAQQAVKTFKTIPTVAIPVDANALANIAFGANLGSYYFDKYYTDTERKKHQSSITFYSEDAKNAKTLYQNEWEPVAKATWFTRNMSNEPANKIYPESFVQQWKQHFKGLKNIKIRVYDEEDMLDKNMGAIYGVGRGSQRPPRMMIVEYRGGKKDEAPVVFVGKGITFDTGGISIKGSNNMWNMKFDMSGAASSMGALYAIAGRKANVNVVAIAALAENMPDGNAQRPGDVVTSMSGKTIQIRSTDAEGRLVLADGIYYGDTTYNPALLIDLATLTGSAARALGKDYAALFTRHDELVPNFVEAGKATGEEVWQLPLNKNHFKAVENSVADVMNSGPKAPGASAGAAFIGTFVRESTPWIHLDIAGVAWGDSTHDLNASPGSSGYGVRLLNGYVKKHFEK